MNESWMEAYLLSPEAQTLVNKMVKSGEVTKSSVLSGLTVIQSLHEGHMEKLGDLLGVPEDRVTRSVEVSRELAQRLARVILTSDLELRKDIDNINEVINNNEEAAGG